MHTMKSEYLQEVIERYRKKNRQYYPERLLADKIYRNRDNLSYCKERGNCEYSGSRLEDLQGLVAIDKKKEYKDNCDRVEVERAFSHAKGKFGLGRVPRPP